MIKRFLIFILPILFFSAGFAQSTILWSVKDTSSNNQSYIIGTFHQLGNSFVDSFPKIRELLLESDIAIFESKDNSDYLVAFLNKRDDNFLYKKNLKKSDVEFLESFSTNWFVPIRKLTPIELLIKLQQEYTILNCETVKPTDTWKHFDKYLIHIATLNNINVFGLETDSIQTMNINEISDSYNWKKNIHKLVLNIKYSKNKSSLCYNAFNYMAFSFNYQLDEQCGDSSLIERNEKWLLPLTENLKNKKTFIAVGLLHLYGNCGLITKLREAGSLVEPVPLKL